MSTRSRIAIKTETGYRSIYCHWDGYPTGVGKTLMDWWDTPEKIHNLMDLGDLSQLGDSIPADPVWDTSIKGMQAYAYRGDYLPAVETKSLSGLEEEYTYVYRSDMCCWLVRHWIFKVGSTGYQTVYSKLKEIYETQRTA